MQKVQSNQTHRDIPNRTDEQLQKEYSFLKNNLQYVTDPGFGRFLKVESEMVRRHLITSSTYDA